MASPIFPGEQMARWIAALLTSMGQHVGARAVPAVAQ